MGNKHAKNQKTRHGHRDDTTVDDGSPPSFKTIRDKYETVEQVTEALQQIGVESCNLIIGIDYTISNTSAGKNTFGGKCLHSLNGPTMNPYQHAIWIMARTLENLDEDKLIPCFGFGDSTTKDKSVFPFFPDRPCNGVQEVLTRYTEVTPSIKLGGPTSFAPAIREAIRIVKEARSYHILLIIADGGVTPDSDWAKCTGETIDAIVEASNYPLSIITIGVGDGPWDVMEEFDDNLPQRKFDNFQFVDFCKTVATHPDFADANFALAALQEIPEQYYFMKKLGYLG